MAKRALQNTLDRLADELVRDILVALRDVILAEGVEVLGIRGAAKARAASLRPPSIAPGPRRGGAAGNDAGKDVGKDVGKDAGKRRAAGRPKRARAAALPATRRHDVGDSVPPSGNWSPDTVTDPEALLGAFGIHDAPSPAADRPASRRRGARTTLLDYRGDGLADGAVRPHAAGDEHGRDPAADVVAPPPPDTKPALREDETAVRSRGGNLVIRRGRGPADEPAT